MATKEINVRSRMPRDTSANWTSHNPVLLDGEVIIVDTDSGEVRYKVGDGAKTYTQLPFQDEVVKNLINAKQSKITANGILQADGNGNVTAVESISASVIESITNSYDITIAASAWTASGSVYKYTYSNSAIRAVASPIIACTSNQTEYNYLTEAEATAKSGITFTASKKPTAAIALTIVDMG